MQNQNLFNVPPTPYGTNNIPASAIVAYKQNAWSPMILGNTNTAQRVMRNSNMRFGRKGRTRKQHRKAKKSRKTRRN